MTLGNVELVSKDKIRPSSPTPNHLKVLKLSIIDQILPPVPVSVTLFYAAHEAATVENRLHHLKQSLSEVLTRFYPLAGRISNNQFVDCNDEGINFFQTRVYGQLSQIPDDHLSQLLPTDDFFGSGPKVLLSVQANIFDSGEMAIALRISHKVSDACSLVLLINHWVAATRGDGNIGNIPCPRFDAASVFVPLDSPLPIPPISPPKPSVVCKRFLFDASNIAQLKAKASNNGLSVVACPTRVEAVSALIWRCTMAVARKRKRSVVSESIASVAVNLRGRMVPPLSDPLVGNLSIATMATSTAENPPKLDSLLGYLREAIKKIDHEYVSKFQAGDGFWSFLDSFRVVNELCCKGGAELYNFTSWCRFPFYEADFGWGTPVWAVPGNQHGENLIMLMDTRSGNGIEAWVYLDGEDMALFEREPELNAFTSTTKFGCELEH